MKNYGTNENTAHQWAHSTSDNGRSSTGNLYFEGKVIYSCGSHYPMARIDHVNKVVLFNSEHSTPTTEGKHKNAARRAIPDGYAVICVPCIYEADHELNATYLEAEFHNRVGNAKRATRRTAFEYERAQDIRRDCILYCEVHFVDIPNLTLSEETIDFIENRIVVQEDKRVIREAKERKQRERQRELMQAKLEDQLQAWRNHEINTLPYVYGGGAYLRLKGDVVQTSQSVSFPKADAVKFWKLYQAMQRSEKRSFEFNGSAAFKFGKFPLTRIEVDGTIIAGCHKVTADEAKRFACELGLMV